jgi:hypothetical protein
LGVLLLVGLLLRLPGMGDGLTHDEAYTWEAFASRSVATITGHYPVPNNHIFHSLLVKLSAAVVGDSETGLRLPALLAGLLAIPATWWFAASVGRILSVSPWVPGLAAAVVALSPAAVTWSHQARGYTLILLLASLAAGALLRAQVERRRAFWPAYSAALFLAVWTQPSAALLVAGLALWSVVAAVRSGDNDVLTGTLAAHAAVLVAAWLAYASIFDLVLLAGAAWGVDLAEGSFQAFGGLLWDVLEQTGVLVVVLTIAAIDQLRRRSAGHLIWLPAALLGAALLVPLVHGIAPQARGYLFLMPAMAVWAALGVDSQAGRRRSVLAALLLASTGLLSVADAVTHEGDPRWRDLGRQVSQRSPRGELLVSPFGLNVQMRYYAQDAIQQGVVTTLMDGDVRSLLFVADDQRYRLDGYVMATLRDQRVTLTLPPDAFEEVYASQAGAARRGIYRLRSSGQSVMPAEWQWNAHPEEVEQVEFGVSGPAVSQQQALAIRNAGGRPFRLFSRARFRPSGPGLCVVLAARTDPRTVVSIYRASGGGPDALGVDEQVTEVDMLPLGARPVEGVGRDQRMWQMEAFLWPVDGSADYGVYVRGTEAPHQDVADIRVLFFPFP